jgi:hypothetical protein
MQTRTRNSKPKLYDAKKKEEEDEKSNKEAHYRLK